MADGNYFYTQKNCWPRAVTIRDGFAYGLWIAGGKAKASICEDGKMRGPVAGDDPDWIAANSDCMGRLFRERSNG